MDSAEQRVARFGEYLRATKSPNTASGYSLSARKFEHLVSGAGLTFATLPRDILTKFGLWQLKVEQASLTSVKLHIYGAKKYLAWLQDQGVEVARDIRQNADLPKAKYRVPIVLSAELLQKYVEVTKAKIPDPTKTAMLIMPLCGLRSSELVALKLDQIHVGTRSLSEGYSTDVSFKFIGKGDKERFVPLSREGVPLLKGYLTNWRGSHRETSDWLFPGHVEGTHLTTRALRQAMKRVRFSMNMMGAFSPHTLRRTYLSMLHDAGVPPTVIAKIAGHETLQTTYKSYLAMGAEKLSKAVDGINFPGYGKVTEAEADEMAEELAEEAAEELSDELADPEEEPEET